MIMVLFVLRKLILQTRMRSHQAGLDVWFLVGLFDYFHTSFVRTARALVRLRGPELSLVPYVISTIISWAGSYTSGKKSCASRLFFTLLGKCWKYGIVYSMFGYVIHIWRMLYENLWWLRMLKNSNAGYTERVLFPNLHFGAMFAGEVSNSPSNLSDLETKNQLLCII